MQVIEVDDIVILKFDSTAEARKHGKNLSAMGDGNRFYAWGPDDTTEDQLRAALKQAKAHGEAKINDTSVTDGHSHTWVDNLPFTSETNGHKHKVNLKSMTVEKAAGHTHKLLTGGNESIRHILDGGDIRETLTHGIKNAMARGATSMKCDSCGFSAPVYPGRYPKSCPECNSEWGMQGEALRPSELADISSFFKRTEKSFKEIIKMLVSLSKKGYDVSDMELARSLGEARGVLSFILNDDMVKLKHILEKLLGAKIKS